MANSYRWDSTGDVKAPVASTESNMNKSPTTGHPAHASTPAPSIMKDPATGLPRQAGDANPQVGVAPSRFYEKI